MATQKTRKPKPAAAPKTGKAPASPDYGKLVDLTPDEVEKLPKARPGFERFVEPIVQLYEAHPDLVIKGLDIAEVRGRFAAFAALEAVERSAAKHLEMIQETRLLNSSKVWKQMLEIYAKAQAAGRTDADVKRGIADFVEFMKTGPKTPKKDK